MLHAVAVRDEAHLCRAARLVNRAAKGYLDAAEQSHSSKIPSRQLPGEAITDGLNGLAEQAWDQFEQDDDEEVELCRIDVCQYKEEGEDPEDPDVWERCRERKRAQCYSTTVSDELPLEIEKVRKDGWVFRKPYEPGHGYDSDDEHESTYWDALTHRSASSELSVRLPEDVASSVKSARRYRARTRHVAASGPAPPMIVATCAGTSPATD